MKLHFPVNNKNVYYIYVCTHTNKLDPRELAPFKDSPERNIIN